MKCYSAATHCQKIKTAKFVLWLNMMCTYYGIWCSHLKSASAGEFQGLCDAVKVAVVLVRNIYMLPQCENCTIKFYNLTPEGLQSWLFSGLACGPWIFTTLGTYYCIMIWAFHSTEALQTTLLSRSNLKDKKLLVFLWVSGKALEWTFHKFPWFSPKSWDFQLGHSHIMEIGIWPLFQDLNWEYKPTRTSSYYWSSLLLQLNIICGTFYLDFNLFCCCTFSAVLQVNWLSY